jgi:hypothetical protein
MVYTAGMPGKRTIPRRQPMRSMVRVRSATRNWLLTDDAVKKFNEQRDTLRRELLETLQVMGEEDDKGHRHIDFGDDPVEGRVKGLTAQKRVTRSLNAERAQEYLEAAKLWEKGTELVPAHRVISEENILGLNFAGAIPDDDLEKLYDVTETFAFVPDRLKK